MNLEVQPEATASPGLIAMKAKIAIYDQEGKETKYESNPIKRLMEVSVAVALKKIRDAVGSETADDLLNILHLEN